MLLSTIDNFYSKHNLQRGMNMSSVLTHANALVNKSLMKWAKEPVWKVLITRMQSGENFPKEVPLIG